MRRAELRGILAALRGDVDQAARALGEAAALANEVGNTLRACECDTNLALLLLQHGRHDEARGALDRAAAAAEACGDLFSQGRVHLCRGESLRNQGRWEQSLAEYDAAVRTHELMGGGEEATSRIGSALALMKLERYTEADRHASAVTRETTPEHSPSVWFLAWSVRAAVASMSRDWDLVSTAQKAARTVVTRPGVPRVEAAEWLDVAAGHARAADQQSLADDLLALAEQARR